MCLTELGLDGIIRNPILNLIKNLIKGAIVALRPVIDVQIFMEILCLFQTRLDAYCTFHKIIKASGRFSAKDMVCV